MASQVLVRPAVTVSATGKAGMQTYRLSRRRYLIVMFTKRGRLIVGLTNTFGPRTFQKMILHDHTRHNYKHVISYDEIGFEEQAITSALAKGGYDTIGLTFEWPATQAKLREIWTKAHELNIEPSAISWNINPRNGVEVAIEVRTEVDLVALRLALSNS